MKAALEKIISHVLHKIYSKKSGQNQIVGGLCLKDCYPNSPQITFGLTTTFVNK